MCLYDLKSLCKAKSLHLQSRKPKNVILLEVAQIRASKRKSRSASFGQIALLWATAIYGNYGNFRNFDKLVHIVQTFQMFIISSLHNDNEN